MKKDNRGVSLVEIIIVISIMLVVAGGFLIGIGMVSSKPAMKCAQKIVFSLTRNRTTAMGKVGSKYKLYVSGNKVMAEEEFQNSEASGDKTTSKAVVGENGVKVSYRLVGETQVYDSDGLPTGNHQLDGAGIVLQYERGSGSFRPTISSGSETKCCANIYVNRGRKTYVVKLEPLTGKVYME